MITAFCATVSVGLVNDRGRHHSHVPKVRRLSLIHCPKPVRHEPLCGCEGLCYKFVNFGRRRCSAYRPNTGQPLPCL